MWVLAWILYHTKSNGDLSCLTAAETYRPCHRDERWIQRRAEPIDGAARREYDAARLPSVDLVKSGAVGSGGGEKLAEESGAVGCALVEGHGTENVDGCGIGLEGFAQELRGGLDVL